MTETITVVNRPESSTPSTKATDIASNIVHTACVTERTAIVN